MTYIALGMAAIGRPHYINIKTIDSPKDLTKAELHAHATAVLDAAYAMSIRHIDTAPGYGIAEEILIDWLRRSGHEDMTVSTKWGYTYTANFEKNPLQHEVKEHSLHVLQQQWLYSRQLLPPLNMYQIHSATPDSGVLNNQGVLDKLFELKEQFGIEIGLTTSGLTQNATIQQALKITNQGKPLFTIFQVTYNVFEQSIADSIALLKNQGARIIIKEGLANGRIFTCADFPQYAPAYALLERLAGKYHVGVDAVALRFCIDALRPLYVLSGAATIVQLKENLLAETFTLQSEELEELKSIHVASEAYWNERKQLKWN